MRRVIDRVLLAVLSVGIAITVWTQLGKDSSPAHTVCADVARSGRQCVVDPRQFGAQLIVVDNGTSKSGALVISEDGKVIGVVPLD